MLISADLLRRVGVRNPDGWAGPLSAACASQGITTAPRIAAFLANVLHETAMLRVLRESLNYSASALLAQWPNRFTHAQAQTFGRTSEHAADEFQIAEHAYGNRYGNGPPGCGDGWTFRGHGGLCTTFRANHDELGKAIGWKESLESLPDFLATVPGACTSAVLYWTSRGCNRYADHGDIKAVRRIINGGLIGFPVVNLLFQSISANLKIDLLNASSLQKAQTK